MQFKNKVILVTGSNSRIGEALCFSYLNYGAKVYGFDVKIDSNKPYKQYCVDIRNYDDIVLRLQDILAIEKQIDILINCAGGNSSRVLNENVPFNRLSIEAINWGIDVNLKGPIYMARACINHMIDQKSGVIINVGSISGTTGSSSAIDYSSAKSGLIGLTKSLALLGAPHNIRCCMVTPGPVLTRSEMSKMTTPLGRAADVKEIVDLILYLSSDKAGFITGSNYLIDGGRSCGGMKHES